MDHGRRPRLPRCFGSSDRLLGSAYHPHPHAVAEERDRSGLAAFVEAKDIDEDWRMGQGVSDRAGTGVSVAHRLVFGLERSQATFFSTLVSVDESATPLRVGLELPSSLEPGLRGVTTLS